MLTRRRRPNHVLQLERLEDRTVPAAPVNSFPGTQTVIEENILAFSAANGNGLSFTDADGPGPYQVELVIVTNPGTPTVAGALSVANTAGVTITGNGTNALTILGSFADVHTALDTLTLLPSINLEGNLRLIFETHDNFGGGEADTDFINITVTPNQSPTNIKPGTQTTALNTPLPFSSATGNALSITDPDGPGPFQVELVLVDTASPPVAAGTLSLTNTSGITVSGNNSNSMTLVGSLTNINAALNTLVYQPATGYTGQARIVFETHDSDVNSTRSDTDFILINVFQNLSPSNVNLDAPATVLENGQITLNGSFTNPDGDAHTVTINFGDGSSPVVLNLAAGENAFSSSHTYLDDAPSGTASDVKTISVTISDGPNNVQANRQITVNNVAPSNATVSATTVVAGGSSTISVTFNDPGTLDPHLLLVDFGDGQSQNFGVAPGLSSFNFTHLYANPGNFTISVVVNDDDLGSAPPAQTTVTVLDPVPVVTPPANQNSSEGASTSFQLGSFADANNSGNYTVTVNWGDGSPNTVFNQATAGDITLQNHTFAQDGNFNVTITVEDADGTSAPVSFQAVVGNVLPVRTPPAAQAALAGISQLFELGSFIDPGSDAAWGIVVNWGDGSPNTAFQVNSPGDIPAQSHTYATDGTFIMVVNVSDDDGTQATTSQVVVANPIPLVTPPSPQSSAEGANTTFLLGDFSDVNNSGNYTVTVNWGDGTPDTVFNQATAGTITAQNHTYAQDGNFNVTITVADVNGTSIPVNFQASVSNVLPVAVDAVDQFAVATIAQSFELGNFSDPGADAPWNITVNWGDGSPNGSFTVNSPGTLPPLTHTFASAGTFNVVVTVQDDDGSATSDYLVTVIPPEAHLLGNVFRDFNNNGIFNSPEVGLAGITVFADVNSNGVLDGNEPSAISDQNGNYDLTVGFEGAVNVRQVIPDGFKQTTDNPATVFVNFGDTVSVESLGLNRIITPTVAISGRTGAFPFLQARDVDGSLRFTITPYAGNKKIQDIRLATGDVNDDGIEDIFTIPGVGGSAQIKVFDGNDGTLLKTIQAFNSTVKVGFSIATGDVNGDGIADAVVGTDKGVTPTVVLLDGATGSQLNKFTVPSLSSKTGVRVALGDINGDGALDIITSPGVSRYKTPIQLRAVDALSGILTQSLNLTPLHRGTASLQLTAGDLDGDGQAELVLSTNRLYLTKIQKLDDGQVVTTSELITGTNTALKDVNGDGIADKLFAGGKGQSPRITIKDGATAQILLQALILNDKYRKGLVIA